MTATQLRQQLYVVLGRIAETGDTVRVTHKNRSFRIVPEDGRTFTERSVRISPMVVLELHYLLEVARIAYPGDEISGFLADQFRIVVDTAGMGEAVLHAGAFLLTRDETVRRHYAAAVW